MSGTYRDETESLRARIAQLEDELAARERAVADLNARLGDQDAVFSRLRAVVDGAPVRSRPRWLLAGGALLAIAAVGSASLLLARSARSAPAHVEPPEPREAPAARASAADAPVTTSPLSEKDACARLGVHLTIDGEDAEAPAASAQDVAGHKYRRDGTRAPWLTVNGGPLYVHAWGDFSPRDTGTTRLTLLTVATKGEHGGYTLARGGRSLLEVSGSGDKRVWGRFEADVSKVDDTTREPPFGTPVTRLRGTFCLPELPANPSDTGP